MEKGKEPRMIAIKGVDPELWRQFRAECVLYEQNTGERLNLVLTCWLAKGEKL